MSKLTQFLVKINGEEHVVDTAKEVSRLLGRKVTRAQIVSCMVPEVSIVDTEDGEVLGETTENKESFGTFTDKDGEEHDLTDPLHRSQFTEGEAAITKSSSNQEIEDKVNEILDGNPDLSDEDKDTLEEHIEDNIEDDNKEDEPIVCSECGKEIGEDEDKYLQDDGTYLCEDCNHAKNNADNKPDMKTLLEKMRALNAKKQADKGNDTTDKGSKGSKGTMKFNGEFPEVGTFKEEKQLKKFYKQLTDEQLDEWIELEGLTYKPSDNEPINRMRKCMAILYLHFPRETKSTGKSKSKYADLTTEELLQIALDNDIEVKEAKGDPRILRMYTIMALKAAGLLE